MARWPELLAQAAPHVSPAGRAVTVDWCGDALTGGSYSAMAPDVDLTQFEHPHSNVVFAGEHTNGSGTMDGAIRSGEHKGTVDLKHTGVVPIVDMARVHALAGGHEAVNTHDRLVSAAAGGAISEQSARDLREALEFLAFTRIQHQARQISAGQAPDNFLPLDDISNFERTQLKDAFTVVQSLQNVLGNRYQAGRF